MIQYGKGVDIMTEKEIFKQARKDWEELQRLYKLDGTTEYGVVSGHVIGGELQEFVSVYMGDGHTLVFKSIDKIEG